MKDFFEFVVGCVVVFALVIGGVFGLYYALDRADCRGLAHATGHHTKYESLTCYVQVGDDWIPSDQWAHNSGK